MATNLKDALEPGVDYEAKISSHELCGQVFDIVDLELIEKIEERIDPVDGVLRDMVVGDYYKIHILIDGGNFVWHTGAAPLRPLLKGLLNNKDRLPVTTEIRAAGQTYEFTR